LRKISRVSSLWFFISYIHSHLFVRVTMHSCN
jgi:hypothetical protein